MKKTIATVAGIIGVATFLLLNQSTTSPGRTMLLRWDFQTNRACPNFNGLFFFIYTATNPATPHTAWTCTTNSGTNFYVRVDASSPQMFFFVVASNRTGRSFPFN